MAAAGTEARLQQLDRVARWQRSTSWWAVVALQDLAGRGELHFGRTQAELQPRVSAPSSGPVYTTGRALRQCSMQQMGDLNTHQRAFMAAAPPPLPPSRAEPCNRQCHTLGMLKQKMVYRGRKGRYILRAEGRAAKQYVVVQGVACGTLTAAAQRAAAPAQ